MLTVRGWWLLIVVVALLVLGLGTGNGALILVCLTLLAWMLGSWLSFAVKVKMIADGWRVERELRDERGPVRRLRAGQKVDVVVRLRTSSRLTLPFVWVADRVPVLGRLLGGENRASGELMAAAPVEVKYRIACDAAGHLRFEGLQVQVADLEGFFQYTLFVRSVEVFTIYPVMAAGRGQLATLKRHNVLPILGTHRHRRPGSGSELLDLRDYLPGDPPKTIAWKASARRDRLMTKEFESEVPIRCTLFVDVSMSVRVGQPGRNVLTRLIEIAGAVVQASGRVKDLTGLCVFDERRVLRVVRPRRGSRHALELSAALADAADLPLLAEHVSLDALLPLAYGLAQDVYPDLLDADVNAFPFWLPWWSPQPGYTREVTLLPGPGVWTWLRNEWRKALGRSGRRLLGRLLPRNRRKYRWQKQLAAIVAVRHELGPGGLARLLEDDAFCKQHLQRFLAEHQVSFPIPLYDAAGRYLFASPEKIDVLSAALLHSVARGHDNELFVLLVDMLEVGARLDELLRAIQVARARHHRVMVICPWPSQVPLPTRADSPPVKEKAARSLQELYFAASRLRLQQAGAHVQRTLARLGVPVLFSPEDRAVSMILHQMNELRLQERGGP